MLCPNCGLEQPEASECKRCGVIVAKFQPQVARPRPAASAGRQPSVPPAPPFLNAINVILGVCMVIFLIFYYIFRIDNDMSPIVICVVFFVTLLLVWWWRDKKQWEQLEGLAAELGGKVTMPEGDFSLKTEAGEATVHLIPGGGKNSPSHLDLLLEPKVPIGFSFHMGKSNFLNRPIPGLGKKRSKDEFKTGDSNFDEKYWINGDDQARMTRFFQDVGRREAMEYFFRNGFREINGSPKAVTAVKYYYRQEDLVPELIRMHLEQLGKLTVV